MQPETFYLVKQLMIGIWLMALMWIVALVMLVCGAILWRVLMGH